MAASLTPVLGKRRLLSSTLKWLVFTQVVLPTNTRWSPMDTEWWPLIVMVPLQKTPASALIRLLWLITPAHLVMADTTPLAVLAPALLRILTGTSPAMHCPLFLLTHLLIWQMARERVLASLGQALRTQVVAAPQLAQQRLARDQSRLLQPARAPRLQRMLLSVAPDLSISHPWLLARLSWHAQYWVECYCK